MALARERAAVIKARLSRRALFGIVVARCEDILTRDGRAVGVRTEIRVTSQLRHVVIARGPCGSAPDRRTGGAEPARFKAAEQLFISSQSKIDGLFARSARCSKTRTTGLLP